MLIRCSAVKTPHSALSSEFSIVVSSGFSEFPDVRINSTAFPSEISAIATDLYQFTPTLQTDTSAFRNSLRHTDLLVSTFYIRQAWTEFQNLRHVFGALAPLCPV